MSPTTPPLDTPPEPVRNLEFKAALLLMLLVLLVAGSALYVMYARGVFENTQRLVLVSDDSEGVVVGMDMTFAGFSIGRVSRIELAEDGNVRILVDVPVKDAKWLRSSSVFTMEKALVGGTKIRAYSGMLSDPPLEDGAEREVLRGDAAAEIPRLMSAVRDLLDNLTALTGEDAPLAQTLANVQDVTGRLKGPQGGLGVLMGNEADARQVMVTLERANALLARVDALAARVDSLVANADKQVFGQGAPEGQGALVPDLRAAVQQVTGLLGEARGTLRQVDALLVEAQGIAANTRTATTDLDVLR
ncbi:MAG: mammalian cell entry protein, partial [Hydrogenophaga sp.]|uniref:MlaD family protein n=1 Tax=Hydrogenophaga sp. TaxID=1904254 RepID=UPI002A35BD44